MKMYLASLDTELELKGSSCAKQQGSSSTSVEALMKLRDFSLSSDPVKSKALYNEWHRRPSVVRETSFAGVSGATSTTTCPHSRGGSMPLLHIETEEVDHKNSDEETKNLLGKRSVRPVSPQKPVGEGRQLCLQACEGQRSGRRSSDVECRRAKRRVLRRLREERIKEREATERCLLRMKVREEKRLEYERLVEMKEARRRQIYAKNAVYRLFFEAQQAME